LLINVYDEELMQKATQHGTTVEGKLIKAIGFSNDEAMAIDDTATTL